MIIPELVDALSPSRASLTATRRASRRFGAPPSSVASPAQLHRGQPSGQLHDRGRCPVCVRTVREAKRLTPRTGTDGVRTSGLTGSFIIEAQWPAPKGQTFISRTAPRSAMTTYRSPRLAFVAPT